MKVYSVTEYREELNELLGQVTVAIVGEVTDFNISQNRFVWFSLTDEQTVVKCFMMAFQLRVPVEDGMQVQVVGSPTMFKKGQVVFQPRTIELVGDGTLRQAYELLKKRLEKEGLFDETRKRPLPRFPQHVGLVTSEGAAAYTDVLRILNNRWCGVEIVHVPVRVQGAAAVSSVVAGLSQLNEDHRNLDCIILTRGGGSLEDLQAFNSEEVARAIFASGIPVVSGVGHERDVTLSDLVADVRASTPSNAAEMVVPDKRDVLAELAAMTSRMQYRLHNGVNEQQQRITTAVSALDVRAREHVNRFRSLEQQLRFSFHELATSLRSRRERVDHALAMLRSLHPNRLLRRGYTMTTAADGTLLRSAAHLESGQIITTRFTDGERESTVLGD